MNNMITYHLIDLENIPVKWTSLIKPNYEDHILIFKLENPNDKNYISLDDFVKFANLNLHITIIQCKNGKPKMNALDFQLSSYFGYLIGTNVDNSFIIYSNDTGFDPVIDFWSAKGINIKRVEENNL